MEKVIRDGKVAVLVSHGWGAGFHTWGAPLKAVFDPKLVELVEQEKLDDAVNYVQTTYPDAYAGGVRELNIEWIPEGAKFIIEEYDGSESIQLRDETDWLIA